MRIKSFLLLNKIKQNWNIADKQYSLEWWHLISEKRCVIYVHLQGSLQWGRNPFNIKHGRKKTLKQPYKMKHQPFYLRWRGKLVTQLLGGITFAYDLYLGHLRDRWKGLAKEYNVEIENIFYKWWQKTSFRTSKRPRKFRTRKTAKKCQSEITVLSQWNGGWPPIST